MRYGPDDTFWAVVDPTLDSLVIDIFFETTVRGLALRFRGGMEAPTLFDNYQEALAEAYRRLDSLRS